MSSVEADPRTLTRCRAVALVGFMGSGKTSVGSRLANRLGWTFVDADDEVEARTGSTVENLFRDVGEDGFRQVEAGVTADLLQRTNVVVATGGGWPTAGEGRLETLPADVLTVWLQVAPEVAVARTTKSERRRPLLEVDDPLARATALLERREPSYGRARLHLDANEGSPDTLADAIARYIRNPES